MNIVLMQVKVLWCKQESQCVKIGLNVEMHSWDSASVEIDVDRKDPMIQWNRNEADTRGDTRRESWPDAKHAIGGWARI